MVGAEKTSIVNLVCNISRPLRHKKEQEAHLLKREELSSNLKLGVSGEGPSGHDHDVALESLLHEQVPGVLNPDGLHPQEQAALRHRPFAQAFKKP